MPKGTTKDRKIPFRIGSNEYPGFSKLIEEMAETLVEIGKAEGLGHLGEHWDGKGPMKGRLEDEIADTIAAQQFVIEKNGLDFKAIKRRAKQKLNKFNRWHMNIQAGREPNDDG